jgi:hypothetical protein
MAEAGKRAVGSLIFSGYGQLLNVSFDKNQIIEEIPKVEDIVLGSPQVCVFEYFQLRTQREELSKICRWTVQRTTKPAECDTDQLLDLGLCKRPAR